MQTSDNPTSAVAHAAARYAPLISEEMRAYFAARRAAAPRVSPYLAKTIDEIAEFSLRGGKMIRPLLVILGYLLASEGDLTLPPRPVLQVATAIELFHKHLLNLDDMADRDELRYGKPSLWKYYEDAFVQQQWTDAPHHGRTAAEIAGVLLGSFAFELVGQAELPAAVRVAIINEMNAVMYWQTVAGWQIHYYQNHQALKDADEGLYRQGMEHVTAYYTFVAPLVVGVLLAEQSADRTATLTATLTAYGRAVGTAFQIHADVLGLFGDPKETGKPVGNDVREGKKTLLLQYAFRAAGKEDQTFLANVCGRTLTAHELARVQSIVRETGALAKVQEEANASIETGTAALAALAPSPHLQLLHDLASYIITRQK